LRRQSETATEQPKNLVASLPLHCNPSKSLILSKIFCACAKVVVCIFLPSIFLPFFSATFAPFRGYPEFGCGFAALCFFASLR